MRPRKISGKNGHEIQLFFLLFFGNKTFRFGSFYNLHFSFPFSNTVCFVLFLVRRIKEREVFPCYLNYLLVTQVLHLILNR